MAGLSMYQLMENAGKFVFTQLCDSFSAAKNIIVLAGHGNNGGDAYIVARLALEAGLHCSVCELGNIQKLSSDARQAREKWLAFSSFENMAISNDLSCDTEGQSSDTRASSVDLKSLSVDSQGLSPITIALADIQFSQYDLCVDGMLGTGLTGSVKSPYTEAIYQLNNADIDVLSIDIPSGMNADTGTAQGIAVNADLTCTFIGIKSGLVTGQGKQFSGRLRFDDLAVGKEFQRIAMPVGKIISFKDLPLFPKRNTNVHKGALGKLLCIGGNESYGGAMRLSAESALRCGAGLVKVFCHDLSRHTVNSTRPEIMVETRSDYFLECLNWCNAVVIGPGLGQNSWANDLLTKTLSHCMRFHKHMVIDADALNLIAENPRLAIARNLAILTPHSAEAGRLLNLSVKEIENNRYFAASELTQKFEAVAVLKGAGTLIAAQENTWVCKNGNPGMATAGMGDVLSGILGAFLAQGMSTRLSTLYGVCLHSYAADMAAKREGQIGLLAGDLFPYLRKLINS